MHPCVTGGYTLAPVTPMNPSIGWAIKDKGGKVTLEKLPCPPLSRSGLCAPAHGPNPHSDPQHQCPCFMYERTHPRESVSLVGTNRERVLLRGEAELREQRPRPLVRPKRVQMGQWHDAEKAWD